MFQAYRKLALIELASQAAIEFKPRQVLVKLDTPSPFWPTKVGVGDNKDRPQKNPNTPLSKTMSEPTPHVQILYFA